MVASTLAWYGALLVFVQMQTMPTAIVCLLLIGFARAFP